MRRLELIFRDEAGGDPEAVRLEGEPGAWRFTRDGLTRDVSVAKLPDGRLSLLFADGRQVCGRARATGMGQVEVVVAGEVRTVALADPLHDRLSHSAAPGAGSGDEEVRALMPGRVVEVRVAEGDRVASGQVVLVLEAMKMQNEIRASAGGVVARCAVAAGQAVDGGALMLVVRDSNG
ncbi:MAG TPA: biotin/lipoyl-containing protein [Thermoanaerobaculia bacterium]|jgi:3-methylcrotonyl-CoA carboxylase alpha subunit